MLAQINYLLQRDLDKLKDELNAYENEADIWAVKEGISNSAGNLTLHLMGNLNHFIGAQLGQSGYVREREKEFTDKVSHEELLNRIDQAKQAVSDALGKYTDADLSTPHHIEFIKQPLDIGSWLTYLSNHLGYHLGQINYHRRLMTN